MNELGLCIARGNIVHEDTQVIVNPANTQLILGAGVAGEILKSGGSSIQTECNSLAPISLGQVAVTDAGNLRTAAIYHVATMKPGGSASLESIASGIKNILRLVEEQKIQSISIPAIGCGIGGIDIKDGAETILQTILLMYPKLEKKPLIKLVLFREKDYEIFTDTAKQLGIEYYET